ncbi:Ribosomal protein S6 kinase alpha-5 [Habropoda laboriosa]|uniref:non-specific serine/threonine protein kinase n=1 Tax=Habropoda laboriosa TaxID=597456 RepID=A0A0L7RCF2_9HYME|nr:PREDICTED: ribosomal protein S6 kinase alpha-5 isoform X1 [Habropoda laboriosa]XP_017798922.1 PREDICTED: ribosomal protein S6 kinase alpha-5 isoform X1 [Habropoda laboriosa]XP_017798923.1 PREDICTED: ribosomal protein S6 kinase alpha-5 isoform X1 [Habropoda laboriosa]XP_017798924.1 PREDICTED: ribosomal protein S6 kinase alpha-5 isoform X1 [Habropoda laboriosa]KOC68480.1 Ribosomal protein S6 kinase alpha-5 [Habropoda laboriosa]
MLNSGGSSTSTMKNPEHESGYFEDGSDVETNVEEANVITGERKYVSTCYGLTKAIHELDVRDSSEPVPDHYEDRLNRVNLADSGGQRVDMTHFDLLKVLGTGAYGKVFLVRKRTGTDAGRLYAMKVLKKASIVQKKKTTEHTKTERQVLEAVRDSPFLVTLHYAFQTDAKLHLILDYVSGGELFTHLYQREHFTEDEARIYIGEVILALEHLHKLGIIYRDIKLENILLDREGHIVLTDFGLSKEFLPHERDNNARAYSFCGTIEYMAPEVVRGGSAGHDIAVDWWSVGVLTYELLTGASPFTIEGEKNTQQDISRRILKTDPPIPSHLSPTVRDFILRLLVKDPRQRLGGGLDDAKELKEHSFFKKAPSPFSWEALERREIPPPFVPRITHELDTSNFSDEFTKMIAADSPAVVPPNYDKIFRGYSYVAPSILFGDNVVSKDIFKEATKASTESQRPSASDVLAAKFEESSFFQTYELDPREEALGDGSFSVCRKCRHRKKLQEYAVKIVSRRIDCGREASLLRTCQGHPNVVKLVEVHQDRAHTYLVMELLSGGELLRRPRPFSEQQASRIMRQLASAVRFMHSRGVVHRDLKPENIVFANMGEDSPVKIVDFGFARIKRGCEPLHTPCFTLPYAAPEVVARQGYDQSCDLWSLGAILYSMLSGKPPFRTGSPDLATRIRAGEIDFDGESWNHVSSLAKEVAKGLLTVDPSKRLTASGLANHPWLAESSSFDVASPFDVVVLDTSSSLLEKPEGFRLREVDGARLAQRRKLHKRSTSSSVSSSASTTSSSPSIQLLRPPSAATNLVTSASPAQPSAFDFGEDKVNEYLSSLSSSSDSNSPRIMQQEPSKKRRRRDEDEEAKSKRHKRHMENNEAYKNRTGPVTRSRKKKLEEQTVNGDDVTVTQSCEMNHEDFREIHRKQKTGKRPKRLATIILE